MNIRLLKAIFVTIIALLCLAYAVQNIVNIDAAYASFAYVMGNADHVAYPKSFMPAMTSRAGSRWEDKPRGNYIAPSHSTHSMTKRGSQSIPVSLYTDQSP